MMDIFVIENIRDDNKKLGVDTLPAMLFTWAMAPDQPQDPQNPAPPAPLIDELIEIFAEDMPNRAEAEKAAQMVLQNRGETIYSDLIWNLTNLRYEPEEARSHWKSALEHKYLVSEKLGRNIGIRLAALDYFTNILGKLARPRVIDPDILERLYRDATLDPLTGLANRRYYMERFATEIARSRRYKNMFVLAIFDIDNFKEINDVLGHSAGDNVLRKIADVIRSTIREVDLGARWGGEEFIILLPETPKDGGSILAERLRVKVENMFSHEHITISGGVAAYPADGHDDESLFSFADRSLYRAKSEGKNRVCMEPSERRAFPRLKENVSVKITLIPGDGRRLEAMTSNISAGGVGFEHEVPVGVTSHVRGEIELAGRTATFFGRVVHIAEVAQGKYYLGVQFLEISLEDQELITKSCRSILDKLNGEVF